MSGYLIGVDIGGTNLRVAVAPTGTEDLGDPTVRRIAVPGDYRSLLDGIEDLAADVLPEPLRDQLVGIGIGIPGTTTGRHATFVPALPYLDGAPLGLDLSERLGATVHMANDAQCALLAEHRYGAAAGHRDVAMIVIGTGVGGAVLIDGRPYAGARGAAGAFGWLPADGAAHCRHGAFEQAVGGRGLAATARTLGRTPETLFDDARRGDGACRRAIEAYSAALGRGLAAVVSTWDPEVLVVGGVISDSLDLMRASMDREISAWASPAGAEVPVVAAECGRDAGVLGATILASTELGGER